MRRYSENIIAALTYNTFAQVFLKSTQKGGSASTCNKVLAPKQQVTTLHTVCMSRLIVGQAK
ncbi:hypothetical protein M378DRAFT_156351 [Amanita muscaria Koide BX008]|uniref:Uncharacterized protein n=1 Tax=Amanita muscaria (strain Koide BX008) TaxID=946122 RepID=A0A0C2T319_AMAMK|nr:hypothetical protein M378DRAFT_156351 [Amanita muscaria Koide BX008]